MPGKSMAQKLQEWHYVIEQTRPLLAETPHLAVPHAALEELLQQVEALLVRSETHRAERLEASRLRKETVAQATEAKARLAAALQSLFGTKSERLLLYGVTPRPRTLDRTTKAEKELAALKAAWEQV